MFYQTDYLIFFFAFFKQTLFYLKIFQALKLNSYFPKQDFGYIDCDKCFIANLNVRQF
jgi:hypothetical protein